MAILYDYINYVRSTMQEKHRNATIVKKLFKMMDQTNIQTPDWDPLAEQKAIEELILQTKKGLSLEQLYYIPYNEKDILFLAEEEFNKKFKEEMLKEQFKKWTPFWQIGLEPEHFYSALIQSLIDEIRSAQKRIEKAINEDIIINAVAALEEETTDTDSKEDKLLNIKRNTLEVTLTNRINMLLKWQNTLLKKRNEKKNIIHEELKISDYNLHSLVATITNLFLNLENKFVDEVQSKKKSTRYWNLDKNILEKLNNIKLVTEIKLPMFVEPAPYKKIKNKDEYVGGYLTTAELPEELRINTLILQKGRHIINITPDFIEVINNLQKIPLKISSVYCEELLKLDDTTIKKESDKDLAYLMNDNKEDLVKIFDLRTFIWTLIVALALKNFIFYQPWAADWRGRFYSLGYPFYFQKDSIIRNMFRFKEEITDFNINDTLTLEKIDSLDVYEKLNYNMNKGNALIGIDATSSVYQIIGGITLNETLLEKTNVIGDGKEKKDIYTTSLNLFKKSMNWEKLKLVYKQYCYDVYSQYDETIKEEKAFKKVFTNEIIVLEPDAWISWLKDALTRKQFKSIWMTFAYNSGIKAMSKKIAETLIKLPNYNTFRGDLVAKALVANIRADIKKQHPELEVLKSFCKFIVDLTAENSIKLSSREDIMTHSFAQNYRKNVKKTFPNMYISSSPAEKKTTIKKGKIYKLQPGIDPDIKKHKLAFMPNYVQYLDSCLLTYVLKHAAKENISILPVHDCFYTQPRNHKKVRKLYQEGFIKLILEMNHYKKILELNNFNNIEEVKNKVEELKKNLTKKTNESLKEIEETFKKNELTEENYKLIQKTIIKNKNRRIDEWEKGVILCAKVWTRDEENAKKIINKVTNPYILF